MFKLDPKFDSHLNPVVLLHDFNALFRRQKEVAVRLELQRYQEGSTLQASKHSRPIATQKQHVSTKSLAANDDLLGFGLFDKISALLSG